jgi:hypothetical protein
VYIGIVVDISDSANCAFHSPLGMRDTAFINPRQWWQQKHPKPRAAPPLTEVSAVLLCNTVVVPAIRTMTRRHMRPPTPIAFLGAKKINLTGWFLHFGGFGLVLFGLIDNSAIPLPGGMDLLTTWLAAGRQRPWFYYALLATVGSAIGAYTTYRLGQKGGKEALEKKLPKEELNQHPDNLSDGLSLASSLRL